MDENNTQMRRSISMPVKPLHLEQKTLKRSAEKETVYATDDSDGDDNADANYSRHRSSPAMVADNSEYNEPEPTMLSGLPKHLRSVRDFFANSVNPIFSIFRKSNTSTNTTINDVGNPTVACGIQYKNSNGRANTELPNEQLSHDQTEKHSNECGQERVVFSL